MTEPKGVLKPLVQKCIVDEARHRSGGSSLAKRPFLGVKGKAVKKKDDVFRRSSKLVFNMPKVEDPDEVERKKTDKMVHKLIKYMKKSWKVKVDSRQAERPLVYRTINTVSTMKPDNWKDLVDRREQTATETGFFCGFDGHYEALINLELDTPMLVFKNLAPDLKITADRWLKMKALKAELKKVVKDIRKREAYHPRLGGNKLHRPDFAKGRLIRDPGGTRIVDEFVRTAERFYKLSQGSKSYAKVLQDWTQGRELENDTLNSGFGVIRGDLKFGFKANSSTPDSFGMEDPVLSELRQKTAAKDGRRDSVIDGRKFQREMLHMEDMILALYDLIRSILNIRTKQLNSTAPLPYQVVQQLRLAQHMDTKETNKPPPLSLLRRRRRNKHAVTQTDPTNSKLPSPTPSQAEEEGEDEEEGEEEEDCIWSDEEEEVLGNVLDIRLGGNIESSRLFNPVKSSTALIASIKRLHSQQEKMAQQNMVNTAENKIKRLVEPADHAAIRLARVAQTYEKLFERHSKEKSPIWHNVHADIRSTIRIGSKGTTTADINMEEVAEAALKKRNTFFFGGNRHKRWPNESGIPTPIFPFTRSALLLPSEEMSRQNLRAKTVFTDGTPPTPIRRLNKLAGVRTTEKQVFNTLVDIKRAFRATEHKVKVYYENEVVKTDWDTVKRFREKLNAISPDPVYQWTVALIRQATKYAVQNNSEDAEDAATEGVVKRQALWYKKLLEECSVMGAIRHNGCQLALGQLVNYCDVDIKTKPHMLSRLALLAASLPTTELAARPWQHAFVFLLEHLYGTHRNVLIHWLEYRDIPFLL